ncbi:methylase [Thiocapsa imhoffii]|uniref:Methylase n=1 Tax=Thiocapsa imhoffii TaxID=382777 RepID=A0A9X0WHQ0_9GAMM|nr:methylase [Thiocapsa imhoffii]
MSSFEKPYSQACEENKHPILEVIAPLFRTARRLLEIGSGTGQHAVFFAAHLPHLIWQTSDRSENLPGIHRWLADAELANLPPPLELDVLGPWPVPACDAVFSANTAHIMSESAVAAMFAGIGKILADGGHFALYGPFNRDGRFTSESNAQFDAMLRAHNPAMGLRDVAQLARLGRAQGLELCADHAMPVNNRLLVWRAETSASQPHDPVGAPLTQA